MKTKEEIIKNLPVHLVWYDTEREEDCMVDKACKIAMDEYVKEVAVSFAKWYRETSKAKNIKVKKLIFMMFAITVISCNTSKVQESRKAHWHKIHAQGAFAGKSFIPAKTDTTKIIK